MTSAAAVACQHGAGQSRRHAATRPLDRPPRHGRFLRVRRAAALSAAQGRSGGDRRTAGRRSAAARGWALEIRQAARLHRPRRGDDLHLRRARPRRVLGHGPDEGRAARPRCHPAAGRLRPLPPLLVPVQGRGRRGRAGHRGPRHRRDLHRPERRARCARRGRPRPARRRESRGARDQELGRAGDRPDLLHRHHAQQAAQQDRQRTGQARRHHGADAGRHPHAHLAAGGAQDQRHRPQGRRQARQARPADRGRHCGGRRRLADRTVW
mmetsp:Transcript_6770/g.28503  ORF Transcript_6770/g.28503 Transcript_6770/m.28503 type:complete len:267 (-) Transcript_6770:2559-3359(-)